MNRAFDASLAAANTFEAQITFEREKYWVEHFNKGVNFFNEENIEGAVQAFEKALSLDPKSLDSLAQMADDAGSRLEIPAAASWPSLLDDLNVLITNRPLKASWDEQREQFETQ